MTASRAMPSTDMRRTENASMSTSVTSVDVNRNACDADMPMMMTRANRPPTPPPTADTCSAISAAPYSKKATPMSERDLV